MADVAPASIGELLKRYRTAAGFTQEELAERAGLSARAIRALETGARRAPRKDTLTLLASALNLTPIERARLETQARQRRSLAHSEASISTLPQRSHPLLVGRQREQALLAQCLGGEGPPVLMLAGEPGIGKSRLLEEAVTRAEPLGWTVLSGGCHRRSAQEPYAPCVDALARFLSSRSHTQQRLGVQGCAWLVRLLPELAQHTLVPALTWTVAPLQERRLMFAAVARFMANVAGPAGTLLVLDDLHWAGVDALDLLAFLLRESDGQRVRVIGAYRETDVAPSDPLPMLLGDMAREGVVTRASLAPLNREEAAHLLAGLLDDMPADADGMRSAILSRAGGVPYYLVSCAQTVNSGFQFDEAQALAVPWSVAESIRQRISLLTEPASDILAIAAVIARAVRRDLLLPVARGLGQSEAATLHALEATTRARLLVETAEGSYTFAHDVIRETVEAEIGSARRAILHRHIAEALERLPQSDDPLERRAAELAWHYARGDELARALPFALQAGDHAEAVYAHSEAELHYRSAAKWAHALGDHQHECEALEKLADVLFRLARYTDAYNCLDMAISLYQADGNWERLTWATAQIARAGDPLGKTADSLTRLELLFITLADAATAQKRDGQRDTGATHDLDTLEQRAERAASLLTPLTAARMYLCLTTRYLFLGRFVEAHMPSEHTVRYAREAGDIRIESLAYSFRAEAQLALGHVAESTASAAHARERAVASGDLEALYVALELVAMTHELQGEPALACDVLSQMLDSVTQLGDLGYAGETLCGLAALAFILGDWSQARRYFEESVDYLRHGEPVTRRVPMAGLTLLNALQDGHAPALDEMAVELPDAISRRASLLTWTTTVGTLAEMEVLAGKPQIAALQLRRAIEMSPARLNKHVYLLAPLAWAELELGNYAAAGEVIAWARQLATAQGNRLASVDIERIDGLLALSQRRWDEAQHALERSLALCQATPYPYAEAKARSVYGDLCVATGRAGQACEQYEQALAICERLGERFYRARIEQALSELRGR